MCFASRNGQLYKCHITLPLVGFFVIIILERKKNFRRMKTWQKVALGTLGLVVANNLLQERPQKERCIRVRNKDLWYPPNNGGL